MSNNTCCDVRVCEDYLKKPGTEIWWEKDLFFVQNLFIASILIA
jgi:hypothetical protein